MVPGGRAEYLRAFERYVQRLESVGCTIREVAIDERGLFTWAVEFDTRLIPRETVDAIYDEEFRSIETAYVHAVFERERRSDSPQRMPGDAEIEQHLT